MSERHIAHVIPEDGTTHEPVECYCHPRIHEARAVGALMGLGDVVGVAEEEPGALIFVHDAARDTGGKWTIYNESDDQP